MVSQNNQDIRKKQIKIFIGSSNPILGKKICDALDLDPAESDVIQFSEGNTMVRALESVQGQDVYVIQGVSHPVNDNFVELLFWLDALKLASARHITAVIPFFSYAKGDKRDELGTSIRARVTAESIVSAGADHIITMDLHSPQIQGFFKKPVEHLYARSTICDYFSKRNIEDLVIASADVGFGKPAFKYAEYLKVPVVIGNKMRIDHSEKSQIWSVVGDVKDKNVLIVDDIVFTGGSLIAMANAVKELGAKDVYAAVCHGVLTPSANKKIDDSVIKELIITDTIERRFETLSDKIKIISVCEAFSKKIRSMHLTRFF